ncbi:MAG: 50S ribosomal protein L25 [Acidobacteria bacterium]|nr:50S ribosomal protein L25 [Acidobacteriota bacterium]
MRKDITIAAAPRSTRGKNEARRLRVSGQMPAVIYGTKKDPVAVSVSPKEVSNILHSSTGHNTIFDVTVDGGAGEPVMIVDWQNHPLRGNLLHIDLQRIDLEKALVVSVPVHVKGEARGVKLQGGLLEVVSREIEIECLPNDIPEFFEVDVTGLGINQAVRAGDLQLAESMTLISPADAVLVHVTSLKAEEAAPAEADKPAEPEVVKAKGKKEDAEAPAADKKKK